jgi:hypothetical protein
MADTKHLNRIASSWNYIEDLVDMKVLIKLNQHIESIDHIYNLLDQQINLYPDRKNTLKEKIFFFFKFYYSVIIYVFDNIDL